ncbi:MAG: glycogen debranching enzyme N-terminal domain-containing protein [Chloroflexi bacterium]|nr:glycogen debranching enzyme N-terminal domain-containing protein [Chloroflexota bacterium]
MTDLRLAAELFTGAPQSLLDREWLVTNGLGGFASGTLAGTATRRYHGLLVAADPPPNARWVLVSGADEFIQCGNDPEVPLSTQEYEGGVLHPRGYAHVSAFAVRGQRPCWRFDTNVGEIEKTIWMERGRSRTFVRYTNHARRNLSVRVRPFVTLRWFHALRRGDDPAFEALQTGPGSVSVRGPGDAPCVHLGGSGWRFEPRPDWYWNFHRRVEQARGFDDTEDAFAPGDLVAEVVPGQSVTMQLAADELQSAAEVDASLARFDARTSSLAASAADPLEQRLRLAADQTLVHRGPSLPGFAPEPNTVIAGYPWFGDWGRDTLIALPGLCLETGRASIAKTILLNYAQNIDQGMVPNRWPDAGDEPEYHSFDAALWFVYALAAYVRATDDVEVLDVLATALLEVIEWHIRGTRHGIHMDPADGLLTGGEDGLQLTWMDAKFEDWVVTPRRGKPVEINALWYAALKFADQSFKRIGWRGSYDAGVLALVEDSFATRFWNPETGGLFDVVDGPDGSDPSIRPNQVIAVAVAGDLLSPQQRASVLAQARDALLTPVGLRSLAPCDPAYCAHYGGGPRERDGAYHQGPVWSWLLGLYIQASLEAGAPADELRGIREAMLAHLHDGVVGAVSELFQPETPFAPEGAPAQAWGAAEWLRGLRLLRAANGR